MFDYLCSLWLGLFVDLSGDGRCNTQPCWELYQKANDYYQADVPGISSPEARKCTVLRTYNQCLTEMDVTTECAGGLNYQGSLRILKAEFQNYNCSEEGPLYPAGPEPLRPEEPATPCKFNGRPIYQYCALFGDPHLVTFSGEQTTCKLEGAWPLIDNEFLTVQVTNSPIPSSISSLGTKAATVTQKVGSLFMSYIFLILPML